MNPAQVQRLEQYEGDATALDARIHEAFRRQDFDTLQVFAERDPILGRKLVRRLMDQGHEPVFEVGGEVKPLVNRAKHDDCLVPPPDTQRVLRAPVRVVLVWDVVRARLFACDCAEHVLHLFEERYPEDSRPRKALETTRAYVRGEVDEDALRQARRASCNAANAANAAHANAAANAAYAAFYATSAAYAAYAADTGDKEVAWQCERFLQYLLGEVKL